MAIFDSILTSVLATTTQAAQAATTAQANVAAAAEPVDVAAVLDQKLADKGNPNLNWRVSIVDLMKLLDLDPSLANRKELATELGYEGEKNGSAEMNIWLHKHVMKGLSDNGGRIPAELKEGWL